MKQSSSVIGLSHLQSCEEAMGWCTAHYKMLLLCAITIMKESRNFELARLKKKENILVTLWFGTFAMLFRTTGRVVIMKTLKDDKLFSIQPHPTFNKDM